MFWASQERKIMKRILILEDNLQTANTLEKIIFELGINVQIDIAMSVKEAYYYTVKNTIDVFLIDIILTTNYPGDVSGIRFAQSIREIPKYYFTPLIFITALADPQLYAYRDIHCFGYIEKPFESRQIKSLLEKAILYKNPESESKKVYLRKDGILYAVNIDDIIYIQVQHHKMKIYLINKEIEIPYITIKQFLLENDCSYFVQCNRYSVINTQYIENIDLGNRYIKLRGKQTLIEIGLTYKKFLLDMLI